MQGLEVLSTHVLSSNQIEVGGFSMSELYDAFESFCRCSGNPLCQIIPSQNIGKLVLEVDLKDMPSGKYLSGFETYLSNYKGT